MKTLVRQTDMAHTIDIASNRAKYDECAKKLLTYKAVIAWILKSCTKEFSEYSVQYICEHCLREEIEISEYTVHPDQPNHTGGHMLNGNERITTLNAEANAIEEQTIYFDIRFSSMIPQENEIIQLIINLEIQLNDKPGYPLVKRGFYYCARMVSEQYGTVFTKEHYEKIRKVYSIWICPDPANKRKNGIFRYHTVESIIQGNPYEKEENYDLMEVVVLNLGDAEQKSENEILDLLNVLFSPTITTEKKKQTLNDDFGIAMTEEFESEVNKMCNLSEALVELGIEKGIEQGKESLVQMMIDDNEPLDKIERYTGYAAEKIKEIAKSMGKTIKE